MRHLRLAAANLLKVLFNYMRQSVARMLYPPLLVYAPNGWKTVLGDGENIGWNASNVVIAEKDKWDAFCEAINGTGPLGLSHEHTNISENHDVSFHNIHITYGYVLAMAAHLKSSLSVLDYGGGLGHYFKLGKAFLPDVEIVFSCKEVPCIAEAGEKLNSEVRWFTDDSCLKKKYDVVMINGSLQYMEHWQIFCRIFQLPLARFFFLHVCQSLRNHVHLLLFRRLMRQKCCTGNLTEMIC